MDNLEDKAWKSLLSQRRLKVSDEAVEEQQRRKSKAPYQYYVYNDWKDVGPDTPMTNIVKLLNRQPRPGDDLDDDGRPGPESPSWTKRDETIEHHSPVFNNWRF